MAIQPSPSYAIETSSHLVNTLRVSLGDNECREKPAKRNLEQSSQTNKDTKVKEDKFITDRVGDFGSSQLTPGITASIQSLHSIVHTKGVIDISATMIPTQ